MRSNFPGHIEPTVGNPHLSPREKEWLAILENTVGQNLPNTDFTVHKLAIKMAMSKRSLEVKTKSLTGLSPRKYIQDARFQEAFRLLENRQVDSVKELAFQVGMRDRANFSRLFKKRFGLLPSVFLKKNR